jgi:hypothetical protein
MLRLHMTHAIKVAVFYTAIAICSLFPVFDSMITYLPTRCHFYLILYNILSSVFEGLQHG